MKHTVIVDHPLFAEGLSFLLQGHTEGQVITTPSDPSEFAPAHALVLVDLFLPERRCGFTLSRHLRRVRPDLIPIIWTMYPLPFHIWAGLEYKIPGFLDKAMPLRDLRYWFDHAIANNTAWPGQLLNQAWRWNEEVAVRLRGLSRDLWSLWSDLLHEKSIIEIASQRGWSKRTVERRLSELYITLDVQSRSEVVSMAWKHRLVEVDGEDLHWCNIVSDFFLSPGLPKDFTREIEVSRRSEAVKSSSSRGYVNGSRVRDR